MFWEGSPYCDIRRCAVKEIELAAKKLVVKGQSLGGVRVEEVSEWKSGPS
jgi:hypothetical protein